MLCVWLIKAEPVADGQPAVDHQPGRLVETLYGFPLDSALAPPLIWLKFNCQFPDSEERGLLSWGRSERMRAMIRKAITLKFVIPTVLVLALGISIGAVYLPDKHLVPDQAEANHSVASSDGITELRNPDGRLSRVHLLLSGMK